MDKRGRSVSFGELGTGTPTGILNLSGSTLITNNVAVGATPTATINFNGGTLRAGSARSTSFIPLSSRLTTYVNGAFGSLGGGAVIDTNGRNVTIASACFLPSGATASAG